MSKVERRTRKTTGLSDCMHPFSPARQDFVAIGLVPHVKDDLQSNSSYTTELRKQAGS